MQQHHLTVSEAAKLYGFARSTINRKLTSGRMSSTVRGDGVRVIAFSELLRVWGEPRQAEEAVQQDAPPAEVFADMLEELKALRSEVAELKAHMMRLPAPGAPVVAPEKAQAPTAADDKPVSLFAAEMAAIKAAHSKRGQE